MNKNSNSLLLTCKKLPISKTDFVPQINGTVKTVLLPDFLIVFNYNADPSEQILAFDLNEKQWLKTSLTGDKLILQPGSSVCPYDNNTIIIFGTSSDQKEGQLNLLTFCKASESDELIVDHDLISLQDRILVSRHSANIIGHFMFIYGGFVNSFASQELSYIDLRTLKITRACQQNGSLPGHLFDHRSIAIKNKIYIYGKLHIYVLDTTSFKWEKLDCGSKVYGTAQVFQDDIYFFGGTKEIPHNYLAIYNTSKNLWYDIAKRGDSPSPAGDYLSAIHENQIIIFDGKPAANTNQEYADLKQMYSFSLVGRTGNDLIHEIALQKALKFGEANQDMRTLDSVTKMLEEKKEYDIVFIVQGKKIPAHKNILALRSPYFSNLFSSDFSTVES